MSELRIDSILTKWSAGVGEWLEEAGIRVVQTPYQAPNAYADPFVRSMKEECLNRAGRVQRQSRLGGLLNFYRRAA